MSDHRKKRGSNGGRLKSNQSSATNSRESIVVEDELVLVVGVDNPASVKLETSSAAGTRKPLKKVVKNDQASCDKKSESRSESSSTSSSIISTRPTSTLSSKSQKQSKGDITQKAGGSPSYAKTINSKSKEQLEFDRNGKPLTRTNSATLRRSHPGQRLTSKPGAKLSRSCDKLSTVDKASSEASMSNGKKLARQRSHGSSGSLHKLNNKGSNGQVHDRVRKIVQEEGRSARNLIAYNVPAVDEAAAKPSTSRTVPKSPRKRTTLPGLRDMSPSTHKRSDDASSVRSAGSRPASSAGSHANRKTDMRARYWAFLFDNLKRAVDEIYQTCESDESVNECKEVIMILQQCTKDFQSLINQWNVMKTYEHLEESGQRPVALAWEVRKTSPGKLHLTSRGDPNSPSPAQIFSPGGLSKPRTSAASGDGTNSWADLVKGTLTVKELENQQLELLRLVDSPQPPTTEPPTDVVRPHVLKLDQLNELDNADGEDGWETVRRSRSKTSPISKASTSSKGSIGSNSNGKFQKPPGKDVTKQRISTARTQGKKTHNTAADAKQRSVSVKSGVTNKTEVKGSNGNSYRDMVVKSNAGSKSGCKPANKTEQKSAPLNDKSKSASIKPKTPRRLNLEDAKVDITNGIDSSEEKGHGDELLDTQLPDSTEQLQVAEQVANELRIDVGNGGGGVGDSEDEEVLAMQLEDVADESLKEQNAAIDSVIQEERKFLFEIEQAQKAEFDQQAFNNIEDELDGANSGLDSMETSATNMDWEMLKARYEADTERRKILGLSWADIDEAESRTPGRGAHMHEKLSSPSRKRSILESKKRHEEKQAKAAELRERFRQEKAVRVKDLTKKVEEVRSVKDRMEETRRDYLEKKLREAEEKRQKQLNLKVMKAHEEDIKANEIAFINTLSEQNKKMDILTKHQDVKLRLLDMQEERQRKIGEKAAKEAAVEERRRALDAERLARLAEMQMKRKRREEEIEHEKIERDKERTEALKAKEKDHKDRLAQLERQQQANIEELQKKIEQKQSESTRRHNERLQHVREKAFIMNIVKHSTEDQPDAPKLEPYNTKKICTVCNIMIPSEVHLQSHLRGQQHQNMLKEKQTSGASWSRNEIEIFNIEHIQDVPDDFVDPKQASSRERSKSLKKRCKKLKQRMQARGNEFEAGLDIRQETVDSQHKAKLNKLVKDVTKFIQSQEKGPWPLNKISALDRALGEAVRILDRKVLKDQIAFRVCGGLSIMTKLLQLLHDENIINQYPKTCSNACQVIRLACKSCFENSHYILFSNKIGVIVDLLIQRLTAMAAETDESDVLLESALGNTTDSTTLAMLINHSHETISLNIDPVSTSLVHTLAVILSCLSSPTNPQNRGSDKTSPSSTRPGLDTFTSRISDVISYVITVGIVDKLQYLYSNVRGSLDSNNHLFTFLQHSISFLTAITKLTAKRQKDLFSSPASDTTPLMQTYEDIELAGIMSLLYGMLLHNVPTRGETPTPPELSPNTLTVSLVGLKLINQLATMDYKLVQRVLGAEGVSLELRHIVSYLIWYCNYHHGDNEELLHEVILCIGYFVVLNPENQATVQSGQSPTILQQLCSLQFQYFSDPKLVRVLYPCLIACCYESDRNKAILEQELSSDLLANFLEESMLEEQQEKLSPPTRPKIGGGGDGRMSLRGRFPENMWVEAKRYFSGTSNSS